MVREDLLGQAASFERAVQTRAWRSALREQKPATFDRAAIERRMKELKGQVTRWTNYLQANQLPFLQVSYEELCADSSGVLASVCSFLGVPLSREKAEHVVESVPLMVQRDATTEQWRQQFLAGTP